MKFEYGKAPIKYTNGVPSHLAGEWPGITSCKFHSYKRVIHPVNCGIIFNEKEPLAPCTRKLLGPKGPTPEYIFKPSCKMVKPLTSHKDRPEGIRYIPCPSKNPEPRRERKHNFEYKEEKDRIEFEKAKNMNNDNIVKKEFNLMELIGFAKKPYEGIPFTIQPGNAFNRRLLNNIIMDDESEMKNNKEMTKKQIRIYQKKKKEEEKKDYENMIRYMKNLDEWDKKYIYKPQSQPQSPPDNTNNVNNELESENQNKNPPEQENKNK